MERNKSEWLEPEKALELLLAEIQPLRETEEVPLLKALGRVAAAPVYAALDNPPFDRSPLDVFAMDSGDTGQASHSAPVRLRISGCVSAGTPVVNRLKPGETIRIMTGAVIPAGCDCVVPKEAVREEDGWVLVFEAIKKNQNVVFQGEDIKKGQLLVSPDDRLDFIHLGILASMGIKTLVVWRMPKIGILSTGDELSVPGQPLSPGKIYNSNGVILVSRLQELGFNAVVLPDTPDDPEKAAGEIEKNFEDLDLLISSGGVSVGELDIIHDVFRILGVVRLFWRMNVKPGSAVLCGLYGKKLFIGLPGNPFSCICVFDLLVKPVLAKLTGRKDLEIRRGTAILKHDFPVKGGMIRRFFRARLENGGLIIPEGHSSGQLFSLVNCNCLLETPSGTGFLPAGTEVNVILF
jgi:molybdopterin molybdotransferase